MYPRLVHAVPNPKAYLGIRKLAPTADKVLEGLLEKVTAYDVNIGLGYVCVRNRIGEESYEEARAEEARLYGNHPLLSKIDKSIVGVPVLAEKLVQIQASSIARNLPEIESLRKILLRGEFDEYPDDKRMHCTARLIEMINQFSDQLHSSVENDPMRDFLMEEIRILEEAKEVGLPNFLPRTAFLSILLRKVNAISRIPIDFVGMLWDYMEDVVMTVLKHHVEDYHQLQLATKRAANNLIAKMKERSNVWTTEIVEMEKVTDFTCIPEYVSEWTKLMTQRDALIGEILKGDERIGSIKLEGLGKIGVGVIKKYPHLLEQAFDLRMRMIAYWKIVLTRLVDVMALHLQISVKNLVSKDIEFEVTLRM
ncbi:hypothetical protein FEM48_ZijujUnG0022700 [Ziziphus jujuba var. spinosa]|uniref:GED domain-containing protein n=1 Tax=Ziziphus jujuba var. spinosa TaxID=714518 RepID=A0A978U9S2_ZIZJJ|nr:hypothetical protein FEM48_ZijujUnG0022700 [Ziziphus jujuba var. spinosa]